MVIDTSRENLLDVLTLGTPEQKLELFGPVVNELLALRVELAEKQGIISVLREIRES